MAAILWEPVLPPIVIFSIGLVLCALAIGAYLRVRRTLTWGRSVFLMFLRVAAIVGICVVLFQPMLEETFPQWYAKRVALVAVDTSKSMKERDAPGQTTRMDAARKMLIESKLIPNSGVDIGIGETRFFQFDETAAPLSAEQLPHLRPIGETTRFHQSIRSILSGLGRGENCIGLFLFSDGHDFEQKPARRTAELARAKLAPIYPIALGKPQTIPDAALSIASYQPSTFIKQQVQIQATVNLRGSESRSLGVELLREGELVRHRSVPVERGRDVPVSFEVGEDEPGQFEYEIRVSPLPGERELGNNRAYTYLNVTDAKLGVLLVEGAPHWDTTFLRRTLARNNRVTVLTAVAIAPGKVKVMAAAAEVAELPETGNDFRKFPLVILGRDVEKVLSERACAHLAKAVADGGTTLVFARGQPCRYPIFEELTPVSWEGGAIGPVRLVSGRSSDRMVPMEVLATAPGGSEALPDLPLAMMVDSSKPLSAVEVVAEDTDFNSESPAFVHRPYGRGQVLAVTVGGMWRFSLNPRSEASNDVYDRFWNQLLLNLLARSGSGPSDEARLLVSSANLRLGEKIHFTYQAARGETPLIAPKVTVFQGNDSVAEVPLAEGPGEGIWRGSILAESVGRFRGSIFRPGEPLDCRFSVYRERRETVEVSADPAYLQRLGEASGGRLLSAATLNETVAALSKAAVAEANAPPIVQRRTLWDRAGWFYLLFLLLGTEWFLRRRWGLT